jgi:hypothetical protein
MSNNIRPLDKDAGERGKLDVAIDRAVRQMMAVDPPVGLRHRVLARLRDQEAPGWGFLPRFAMAGGALAVIVLAVVMMRPGVGVVPPEQSTVASTTAPEPQPAPPAVAEAPPSVVTPPPAVAGPRREPLPAPPQMAEVFGTRDTRVAAATVADVPMDDPFTPETEPGTTFRSPIAGLPPLRIEDLKVMPLQVPALRINPLFEPR